MRKPNIPWTEDQYFLDKEDKVVYLRGSFMRSMALHHSDTDPVPGYEVKLVGADTIQKLKSNPEYLTELKQRIKEVQDAKQK